MNKVVICASYSQREEASKCKEAFEKLFDEVICSYDPSDIVKEIKNTDLLVVIPKGYKSTLRCGALEQIYDFGETITYILQMAKKYKKQVMVMLENP